MERLQRVLVCVVVKSPYSCVLLICGYGFLYIVQVFSLLLLFFLPPCRHIVFVH